MLVTEETGGRPSRTDENGHREECGERHQRRHQELEVLTEGGFKYP